MKTSRLAMAVLALGCALLVWRGPVRAIVNGNLDGALVYACARAWLGGSNPYEAESVSAAWRGGGGAAERDPMIVRGRDVLLYPPPALAALSAWAALPWGAASVVWATLNTALMGAAVVGAGMLAGLKVGSERWWWMMAGGSWLAPFHTCITHGQTAAVVTASVVLGLAARAAGRRALGGALLGLGASIKPQLAGLFLVYEAGRMRWRVVAWGAAVVGALSVAGVLRMEVEDGGAWRDSWVRNVREFAAMGDGRPTQDNPIRHQLVNLHYPLHEIVDEREVVKWGVYALVGGLCAAYAWVDWRARRRGRSEGTGELLSLSMVAVATLLVVYHRFYDAAILVLPLAMAVASSGARRWALLILLAPFFANSAVVLAEVGRRGFLPRGMTESWVWEAVVMPHQAWALVGLGAWLVVVRRSSETGLGG